MRFRILSFLMLFSSILVAQTVIHETDPLATPNAKSALDVQSTTKGILIPNLSTSQMSSLPSPATGLLIYCRTDGYFNYFNGTNWVKIARTLVTVASNPGGSGTDQGVGIGLDDPDNSALLHVNANNKGLLLPRLTTANRDAIAAGGTEIGMLVYNTTTNLINYYNGAWTATTAGATTAPNLGAGTAAGVLIGQSGTVDASAKLEIKPTGNQGFLIPRLTDILRDAIPTPAEGLLLYNTDANQVQYYVAGSWYSW